MATLINGWAGSIKCEEGWPGIREQGVSVQCTRTYKVQHGTCADTASGVKHQACWISEYLLAMLDAGCQGAMDGLLDCALEGPKVSLNQPGKVSLNQSRMPMPILSPVSRVTLHLESQSCPSPILSLPNPVPPGSASVTPHLVSHSSDIYCTTQGRLLLSVVVIADGRG